MYRELKLFTGGIVYTATITDLLCFPVVVLIIYDLPTIAVWLAVTITHPVAKQEKPGEKNREFLPTKYIFLTAGSFNCRKILRHGTDGFTSPKEVVLRIFIAVKNPPPSAGFEPTNLGSSGKH
jgi:hypothetical protein